MTAQYPAVLDLTGVPILVVGGGRIAHRRIEGLLAGGGRPDIIAPSLIAPLEDRVVAAGLVHRAAEFAARDTEGYRLVVAATDRPEVNGRVAAEARSHGAWVNVVDSPAESSLVVPAVVREGEVLLGLSTGGASPLLARRLGHRMRRVVTPGLGRIVRRLQVVRGAVRERWPDDEGRRRSFWAALITEDFVDRAISGDDEAVESRIEACLLQS